MQETLNFNIPKDLAAFGMCEVAFRLTEEECRLQYLHLLIIYISSLPPFTVKGLYNCKIKSHTQYNNKRSNTLKTIKCIFGSSSELANLLKTILSP